MTNTERSILHESMPWIWRVLLKLCPTAWLQWELWGREGVSGEFVSPYERKSFDVEGACLVTLNRD